MSRRSCHLVMLLVLLLGASRAALATTVSATATLTVSGAEQPGDAQNITVSFNGFLEIVHYGQYSTPASLASALAAMFTRDYHRYGLYAKAGANANTDLNVVTFQLIDGQTFGSISYSLPSTSFALTPSGFASSGSVVADSGTVALTVNGAAVSSTHYGDGATPESIALGLATSASPLVNVKADGGLLYITSKTGGSSTNYPYSLSITHDSADFTSQSFQISPMSGNLTGGADQTSSGAQVYSYSVTTPSGASGYDGVGNVTAMQDSVMGASSYSYDNLNRVASSAYSSGSNSGQHTCWSYDSFGNRTNQATSNAAFTNAAGAACAPASGATYQPAAVTVDAGNHLTTTPQLPSGLAGSSGTWPNNGIYDLAGNVINDGVNRYLYDAEGRVCAVQSPTSGMIGYQYDTDGARVGKGTITSMSCDITSNGYQPTTDYVLDQGGTQMDEIAVYPDQTHQWVHTNVNDIGTLFATVDTTGLHFYLNDPLGSRRLQTNQYGVREQTCQSLPFGDGLNCSSSDAAPTEHHFTGKERDAESGLDYFGARYYASSMGRFMSPDWTAEADPVPWAALDNPQSLNLYSYVLNNPLNRTDPFGHAPDPCAGNPNCVTVTADGPGLIPLLRAGGHHFVDQALIRSKDAFNSLSGQFFRRWSTGKLPNPGLHKGFSTPHRLNSAQIRNIIDKVEKEVGKPMSRWDAGDIEKAVEEVKSAEGDTGAFLSHIAENNPTARTVSADIQDVMAVAKTAMNGIKANAGAIEEDLKDAVVTCEEGGCPIP